MGYAAPAKIQFLSDLCQPEGRLFRPRSRDEYTRVQQSVVPQELQKDRHGEYPVDFLKYEQNGQTVWGTYSCPFELMASGMWHSGEPNNKKGNENCVSNTWGGNAPEGLYDIISTTNITSSSVSFPVTTEENSPPAFSKKQPI